MKCWSYLVVSSGKQEETLDFQAQWAQEAASRYGWEIARVFRGVSTGKNRARRLLEQLIAELESTPLPQRPDRVLLLRIDRMGRDALEVVGAVAKLKRLGTMLHTRLDGDLPLERAVEKMHFMMGAGIGEMENETRSDKSRAGHARRRAAGKAIGIHPYGFLADEQGFLYPYEPEATIIRKIFELRLEGYGRHRIARIISQIAPPKLLADGIRTRPMTWFPSIIPRVLKRAAYRGAIVNEGTFDAVQRLARPVSAPARVIRHEFALVGAVRCSCGRMIHGVMCGGRYRYGYYRCGHTTLHEKGPMHNQRRAEASFVDILRRLAVDPSAVYEPPAVEIDRLENAVRSLRDRAGEIALRRRRLLELVELGKIDDDDVADRLAELKGDEGRFQAELDSAQRELAAAQNHRVLSVKLSTVLAALPEMWSTGTPELRRSIARDVSDLVGGLYLLPERKAEVVCYEPPQMRCFRFTPTPVPSPS